MSLLRNPVEPVKTAGPVIEAAVEEIRTESPAPYAPLAVRLPTDLAPSSYVEADEDDGLDSLELTYGSFPRIVLKNGSFYAGTDPLGTELIGQIKKVKDVFIISAKLNSKDAGEVHWSYDNITTTSELLLDDIRADWVEKGYMPPEIKTGLEVVVMVTEGPLAGKVVMLSLPKTAKARLAGYDKTLRFTKKLRASQVITRFSVGPLITSNGNSWNPWDFSCVTAA